MPMIFSRCFRVLPALVLAGTLSAASAQNDVKQQTQTKPAAEQRDPFDLIFIDADKKNNPDYFTWALRLARLGSLIIVDNVVFFFLLQQWNNAGYGLQNMISLIMIVAFFSKYIIFEN